MNSLCSFICRNLYFVFNSEGYFLLYMEFWVDGLFFFQCYEEIFWLLTVIVSSNTPAINYFVVFCIKCHCPSDTFKTFFLFSYILSSESWCDFFFYSFSFEFMKAFWAVYCFLPGSRKFCQLFKCQFCFILSSQLLGLQLHIYWTILYCSTLDWGSDHLF